MSRLHHFLGIVTGAVLVLFAGSVVGEDPFSALNQRDQYNDSEFNKALLQLRALGPDAGHVSDKVFNLVCSEQESGQIRFAAACTLARMYADSRREVRLALYHKEKRVRADMVAALRCQGEGEGMYLKDILALTQDSEKLVRDNAYETLVELRLGTPEIVEHMCNELHQGSDKFNAINVLAAGLAVGRVNRAALQCLSRVVGSNQSKHVQESALRVVNAVDDEGNEADRLLRRVIEGPDSALRIHALEIAEWSGRPLLVSPKTLESLLTKRSLSDREVLAILEVIPRNGQNIAGEVIDAIDSWAAKPVANAQWTQAWPGLPKTYSSTLRQAAAINAILRLGDDGSSKWQDLLHTIVTDQRWRVTEKSGVMGATLRDPRAVAARGLGALGVRAEKSLPQLKSAMAHRTFHGNPSELAVAAAWAIACISPEEEGCLETIRASFWVPPNDVLSPFYGLQAADVIRVLGKDRLIGLLPCASQYRGRKYIKSNLQFYHQLLEAMGENAIADFSNSLLQMVTTTTGGSGWGILELIGDKGITKRTIAYLKSPNLVRREAAVVHLRKINSDAGRRLLQELLEDERAIIRYHVAKTLRHSQDPKILRALMSMSMIDPSAAVRAAAQK